jgi:hypothetical protein
MSKPRLTLAEIEGLSAVELPERNLYAVAVGGGGLVGIGIAIDRSLNDLVDVNDVHVIENSQVCVNVAALQAAAGCQ